MIEVTELKAGVTFELDGKPYKVIKYFHQKLGRGGATVRLTLRNLSSGLQEEKSFSSDRKVDEINTLKKPLQFLYSDSVHTFFMDPKTYDQVEIPISILKEELPFIKEGETVDVLFWDDKALSINIPPKVSLRVVDTPPGVKGNSATNIYKPATLENNLSVKVPLFVNKGDRVVVDTRTGEYVERTK